MKQQNWKNKIIRFLAAQTISLFGSSLVQYAIIWYITLATSSGKMLTISTICGFLPQIIVSFFAGIWIDRYNRKKIVMLSDSLIAFATLLLAIAFISGYTNIYLLFIVLAIRSFGTGIQTPAVNALLPEIVPQEHLLRINGINSTLSSLMMFLSPAISGMILSVAPFVTTLFIDVITAIIGISITFTIHIPINHTLNKNDATYLNQIKDGFAYLKENSFIKRLLIFQIIILILISPSAFLTPLLVSRNFGSEVWRLTASEMTYSLGMVLGGLLITSWGGFKKKIHTTLLAGTLYGIIMISLGLAPVFILYLIFNTMIGITSPCYNAPITSLIQEKVPSAYHGRIFSLMQISSSCALPLGMCLFGPLSDYFKVQYILIVAGSVVCIILTLVMITGYFEAKKGIN